MTQEFNKAPSYLLGQVVATARLLQEVIDTLEVPPTPPPTQRGDTPPTDPLTVLQQKITPLEPYLAQVGKSALVEEMKRVYLLKDQCPFSEDPLDEGQYQAGYQEQMERFG